MASKRTRLNKHLVLNSFLCNLLGKKDFQELRSLLKDTREGFDEEGRSHIFYVLLSQDDLKISRDKLEEYDSNIKSYVNHINQARENPINLKYFQYLSVLFTEIFLDKYFQDPIQLLNELNEHIYRVSANRNWNLENWVFSRGDLDKIAYWMATGSGKTLIFHINYLQFLRYNKGEHEIEYENILLITPSSHLTQQHIQEMNESNIPCDYFYNVEHGYFSGLQDQDQIKVIEIHKLTEEKTDEGIRIDVDELGGKNLVFVDEGHKGSHGETWKRIRDEISREGFSFEYSATFGQATSSKRNRNLLYEYGKSILFDYSYRFFYEDGYGKDYNIINLRDKSFSNSTQQRLMLANLLSFYEQKKVFRTYKKQMQKYKIKSPLWIFVGSKVQKGKRRTQTRSDILQIVKFINKFLTDKDWTIQVIKDILKGKSGLIDEEDRDLFGPTYPEEKLKFIKTKNLPPAEIYKDILNLIFQCDKRKPLHLADLNVEGEIALKAGDSRFFGLINIGDDREFLKLVEKETDIPIEEDKVGSSVFRTIEDDQKINVLIGAKKFLEGWNSYRVSNMGLLHVGKKEGTQVIQLFGRGVRLKGKNFSLKRSSKLEGDHPPFIDLLETLNIFGIQANYMDLFKEHLKNENIETDNYVHLKSVPIKVKEPYLKKELLIPDANVEKFSKTSFMELKPEEDLKVRVDLRPKAEILTSKKEPALKSPGRVKEREIDDVYLNLLDWNEIYFRLLEYKKERKWSNITFDKKDLKEIISKVECYTLLCSEEWVNPIYFSQVKRLQEVVISILKKYIKEFYKRKKNTWAKEHMQVIKLTEDHGNIDFEEYTLKVKEDEKLIFSEVNSMLESKLEELYEEFEEGYLKNVYFERHIYQPLLAKNKKLKLIPEGLNPGEENFIEDLRDYFRSNRELLKDVEIYILRNLPHRGTGFFETKYFYPDFILWIKYKNTQHIIFADPKGLGHMWDGLSDEKIQLHEEIKDIEDQLSDKTSGTQLILDSFIISVKNYNKIKGIFNNRSKKTLEKNHILFQNDPHYIEKMLSVALKG